MAAMNARTRRWLLSILFLALIGRLAALPFDPQVHDDGFTMDCVTAPAWSDTLRISVQDTHVPLYYFVIRLLFLFTPDSLLVARIFSVGMGIAAIYFTFLLARYVFDQQVGLIAAALYAFTPFNIFWSHMARNHQMLALVGVIATYFLFRSLHERSRKLIVAYGVSAVIAVQTNYMGLMILAAHATMVIAHEFRRNEPLGAKLRFIGQTIAIQAVAVITLLPWIAIIHYHLTEGPAKRLYFESHMSFLTPMFHALFGYMSFQPAYIPPIIFIPGLFIFAVVFFVNYRRMRVPEIWLYLLVQPALPFLVARWLELSLAIRHFAYIVPATMIFFAFGLREIWRWLTKRAQQPD